MTQFARIGLVGAVLLAATGGAASADEIIKYGMSVPLSGSGAVWGKGSEWMCRRAAQEIRDAGGVSVKGQTYNFECVAYDNKYTAAEATKVAQTLLNRDGANYMCAVGSAAAAASQSLTERKGAVLFNQSWGKSSKGPNFPLSFSIVNSPIEIIPVMIQYMRATYPEARTIAFLNVNDASGRETEAISRPLWEKAGVKVLTSDFYERGTTEFQPMASRLASFKPDIVDLSSAPPADAGQTFKELATLGFKGIKITDNGTAAESLLATGGPAVEGVYMGAALTLDGPSTSEHQRKTNEDGRAYLGESLSTATAGCYDGMYMLKAAIEKAQSINPKEVAAVMSTVKFKTFLGGETGFGGKDVYGSVQQPLLPVYIAQITGGKLVERARVAIKEE